MISYLNGGPGALLGRKFRVESEFRDQEPPKSQEIEKIDIDVLLFFPGEIFIFLVFLFVPRFSYDFLFKRWSRGGSGGEISRRILISGPGTSKMIGN